MLTVKSVIYDDECNATETEYDCDFVVQCNGTSLWMDSSNVQVRVTGITVYEAHDDDYKIVNVTHDSVWTIYTDKAFEAAISAALGYDVRFTEQGMQEDKFASMED